MNSQETENIPSDLFHQLEQHFTTQMNRLENEWEDHVIKKTYETLELFQDKYEKDMKTIKQTILDLQDSIENEYSQSCNTLQLRNSNIISGVRNSLIALNCSLDDQLISFENQQQDQNQSVFQKMKEMVKSDIQL